MTSFTLTPQTPWRQLTFLTNSLFTCAVCKRHVLKAKEFTYDETDPRCLRCVTGFTYVGEDQDNDPRSEVAALIALGLPAKAVGWDFPGTIRVSLDAMFEIRWEQIPYPRLMRVQWSGTVWNALTQQLSRVKQGYLLVTPSLPHDSYFQQATAVLAATYTFLTHMPVITPADVSPFTYLIGDDES